MKTYDAIFRNVPRGWLLTGLVLALLGGLSGQAMAEIAVGNGYSTLTDASKAGAEAAAKAKAAIGDAEVKLVLVFDTVAPKPEAKDAMLKAVAGVFDASIIYGCSAYAPLTQDSNMGTVGVLALGGDIALSPTLADVEGGLAECGKRIGQQLKAAGIPKSTGNLVVLFGSCHVPSNDALVKGVSSVLGDDFPAAGAAASKGEFLYYQGKRVEKKSNVGLLLSGDFKCSFSAKTAPQSPAEGVIAAAGEAAEEALGDEKDKAIMIFAFDCGGRRGWMGPDVTKELATLRKVTGDIPMFGFYGSGETGPKDNDSAPSGVGYHIIICALLAK